MQAPPAYSAIKVDGVRAYRLAREGRAVELPARLVTLHRLELLNYSYPRLQVRAAVSSGTYIRSLAADIGEALSCGAYLSGLRRERVGRFSLEQATALDQINEHNINNYLMKLEHS